MAKFSLDLAVNALVNGTHLQNGGAGDYFVPDREFAVLQPVLTASGRVISSLAYDKEFAVVSVYGSANISINSGSASILNFNSERTDPLGMHDPASNSSRITVLTGYDGVWEFAANIEFAATTAGTRRVVSLKLNGTTIIGSVASPIVSNNPTVLYVARKYPVVATDYVEVQVFHDVGAALNVNAAANYSPEFTASLVARIA